MRIAIAGTHATGKSTLIDAFSTRHSEYACEPEPYVALQELYGEAFAAIPSIDDFERQLEYQLGVLARYSERDAVIFERSPADFLAYMLSLSDGRSRAGEWVDSVRPALARLDLIVFLPLDNRFPIDVPEDEDMLLRDEVDGHLREMLFGDELDLLASSRPKVIEARGSLADRLDAMERAMTELASSPPSTTTSRFR